MAELVPRGFAQGRVAVRVACALPGGRSYEEWGNWELPAGGAVSANQLQREANAFVQQLAKDGAVPASEVVGIAKDIGQQLRAAANKMSSGGTGAVVGAEELYLMRADVALPGESGGPGRAAEDDNPGALTNCGLAYWQGKGVEKNVTRGSILLGQAAGLRSEHACYLLGWAHKLGKYGIDKDEARKFV